MCRPARELPCYYGLGQPDLSGFYAGPAIRDLAPIGIDSERVQDSEE